ncbi:hypothetical protein JW710_01035 [Candidatus Dojkabacteria bacterium]|nr:hypothetical protein [Candidatus Dojkabacteria bacterium]
MISKSIAAVFVSVVVSAALVVFWMILMSNYIGGGELIVLFWLLTFLLGGALAVMTFRQKVKGTMRRFLLLTGFSAVGFPLFVFAHNMFYALAIVFEDSDVLRTICEVLEVSGFLIAIFACPIGFLVGATGVGVLLLKGKKK